MEDTFGAAFGRLIKRKRAETNMTQAQLAAALYPNLDPEEAENRKGDISKLENGKVANPNVQTVKKLCDALRISDEEVDDLRKRVAMSPSEQLEDIGALTRDQLELLASRFEIEKPHTLKDDRLHELLTHKAEEYRSYRDIIELIDERTAGLANLKAAARDASKKLNFDEVEELLSRVAEVEAEVFASTQEARAANALLRGRVDQAYAIFTAAAESFRELDILEMAKRRDRYQGQLFEHGLRYGGTALSRAIDIQRPGIDALKDTEHHEDWAHLTQNLALALQNLGISTNGEEGTNLLAEAVAAYRDALTVLTREDHPVDWATTTQNLANAFAIQGTRTKNEAGTALLAEAVTAYRDALTVRTRKDHPVDWATTTQNLAIALRNQGSRTKDSAGTALLAAAVTACRDALTVLTREDHPANWAMTTQNLAIALQEQGCRTAGQAGIRLLGEAVPTYRDALTVHTRDKNPVRWALTIQNLAIALTEQGLRTEGNAGTALIVESVTVFSDALTVRTREDHPVYWAMIKRGMAMAEAALADHQATTHPAPHLRNALAMLSEALTVVDPEHTSFEYAQCIQMRDRIQARLDAL